MSQSESQPNAQMMMAAQNLTRMLSRSSTDPAFRVELLSNPRQAVATFYGRPISEVPADFDVNFIENHGDATIVLPDAIDPGAELLDTELETVAGGIITPLIGASLAVVASAIWAGKEIKKLGDDDAWFS